MKNTILKFCIALTAVITLASCTKQPFYVPDYELEDLWAVVESNGKTNTLYEFKNGYVTIYESPKGKEYSVVDNIVTGCKESDFEDSDIYPYCVKGTTVFYGKDLQKTLGDLQESLYAGMYGVFCMTMSNGSELVRVDGFSIESIDNDDDDEYISDWGICGTMTNWGEQPDILMYIYEDEYGDIWYGAEDVFLTTEDSFKFRYNNSWDWHLAIDYYYPVEGYYEYYLTDGWDMPDITVAYSGYYSIFIDENLSVARFEMTSSR